MQNKDSESDYKINYEVVPWWLIASPEISGNILLIGNFNDYERKILSSFSKYLECIDFPSFLGVGAFKENLVRRNFDLVIIQSLRENKTLRINLLSKKLQQLLDVLPTIILLESNPLHIKRLFRDPINVFRSIFYDVRAHQIETLFIDRKIIKLETLSDDGNPHESFLPGTYFTNKNPFRKIEKIKRLLLNRRISRIFFNSQIWTITSERRLFIEILINEVQENEKFNWEGAQVRLLKIILNNGKIIVSLTSKIKNQPEYIIIVPLYEHIVKQRRNEKAAIEFLHSIEMDVRYFVDEIIEGKAGDQIYFAMKEFSGITVDLPNPGFNDLTKNAAELITSMAKIIESPESTNREKSLADFSRELIEHLIGRYPYHKNLIMRIGKMLEHYRGLPLVNFMHGDMKLENFVFEQGTRRVVGIIDLELVEFPGIPLMDLFFLITYNYRILYNESFFDTFTRIVRDELSPQYQAYIENYCRQCKINTKQKRICLVLFFLHNYGKRIFFVEESSMNKEEFEPGCKLVLELLAETSFDLADITNKK